MIMLQLDVDVKNIQCPLEGTDYLDLCPLMGTLDPKKIKNFVRPLDPNDCKYFDDCAHWVAERKTNNDHSNRHSR